MRTRRPRSTLTNNLFPFTTRCRSVQVVRHHDAAEAAGEDRRQLRDLEVAVEHLPARMPGELAKRRGIAVDGEHGMAARSEKHTSELQSLMRSSYAVFCLKKQKHANHATPH